jgi:hypothetical protein
VGAKCAIATIATGGILIGSIMFFGFVKPNQSPGSRLADTLAAENDNLRQQLSSMAPRVGVLEIQVGRLLERANHIHMLLHGRRTVNTTVSGFANAPREFPSAEVGIRVVAGKCER